ncbi:ABC transporter substrate-binding protein [Massiliimalia timonensis]|uniref:ABC transporter substrate-binding protein n=1 Tax=Massiliimalia timonensis TaxID=1987501 RepID=UPI00189CA9AA|nr:ABC transporter substrate-binding protein [Massiliimalia timonensis]
MNHMTKRILSTLMATALATTLLAGCGNNGNKDTSNDTGKNSTGGNLLVWTTSPDDLTGFVDAYKEEKQKTVEVVGLPWDDYQTKLMQSVRSGEGAPDIYVLDYSFAKKWVENDNAGLNLSKEYPDFVKKYEDSYYNAMVEVGRDSSGSMRAVSMQYPIGMLYYQRDIAKEILGSDDPEVVAEAASSLDKLMELGDKVNETYGGDIKLLGNENEFISTYLAVRPEEYVKDDKLIVNDYLMDLFDIDKQMYDKGLFASENGGDAQIAGMTEGTYFLDMSPTWQYSLSLKASITGTEMEGHWGVTSPTWSNFRGGSWWQVYKNSENKDEAIDFLDFMLFNEELLYQDTLDRGDFTSNKAVAKKLAESGYEDKALGGQELYAAFQKEAEKTSINNVATIYDDTVQNALMDASKAYKTNELSLDDAVAQWKSTVQSAYPEIQVD